jgi:hypothetical protein
MLHPRMVDMIEYAKEKGARIWLNTNGSMFGPLPKQLPQARTDHRRGHRPHRVLHGRRRRGDLRQGPPAAREPAAQSCEVVGRAGRGGSMQRSIGSRVMADQLKTMLEVARKKAAP